MTLRPSRNFELSENLEDVRRALEMAYRESVRSDPLDWTYNVELEDTKAILILEAALEKMAQYSDEDLKTAAPEYSSHEGLNPSLEPTDMIVLALTWHAAEIYDKICREKWFSDISQEGNWSNIRETQNYLTMKLASHALRKKRAPAENPSMQIDSIVEYLRRSLGLSPK